MVLMPRAANRLSSGEVWRSLAKFRSCARLAHQLKMPLKWWLPKLRHKGILLFGFYFLVPYFRKSPMWRKMKFHRSSWPVRTRMLAFESSCQASQLAILRSMYVFHNIGYFVAVHAHVFFGVVPSKNLRETAEATAISAWMRIK